MQAYEDKMPMDKVSAYSSPHSGVDKAEGRTIEQYLMELREQVAFLTDCHERLAHRLNGVRVREATSEKVSAHPSYQPLGSPVSVAIQEITLDLRRETGRINELINEVDV